MINYLTQIKELAAGKREQLKITPETFHDFRSAWLKFPQRQNIVGEAQQGGTVIYRYKKSTP
mgnify:CR=1 FL=1